MIKKSICLAKITDLNTDKFPDAINIKFKLLELFKVNKKDYRDSVDVILSCNHQSIWRLKQFFDSINIYVPSNLKIKFCNKDIIGRYSKLSLICDSTNNRIIVKGFIMVNPKIKENLNITVSNLLQDLKINAHVYRGKLIIDPIKETVEEEI